MKRREINQSRKDDIVASVLWDPVNDSLWLAVKDEKDRKLGFEREIRFDQMQEALEHPYRFEPVPVRS